MSEALLWITAFAAAIAYGILTPGQPKGLAVAILKTVPVATFALIAWRGDAPTLLVVALVLSALGDFLLVFARSEDDTRPGLDIGFLGGLGAFLFGHIAYAALFASAGMPDRLLSAGPVTAALAMTGFAAVMGLRLFRKAGDLRLPVTVYVAAILAMGLTSLMTGRPLAMAGALSFMASDALLGTEKFLLDDEGRARWHRIIAPALWTLYVVAQALILAAFL